jgi:hypothetical protein
VIALYCDRHDATSAAAVLAGSTLSGLNGFAGRLAGAMVADASSAIDVVRYRALATNTASLAIAHRLGFRAFGQNFRARRRAI